MLPNSLIAERDIVSSAFFVPSGERVFTFSSPDTFIACSTPLHVRADKESYSFVGDGKWRTFVEVKSDRVRSLKPFAVEAEGSGDQWTVNHAPSEVFGAGRSLQEAREDFRVAALDLMEFLGSLSPEQLGPVPEGQLKVLRQHLSFA